MKKMPRPGIEPRNLGLQGQYFIIKLPRPTTSQHPLTQKTYQTDASGFLSKRMLTGCRPKQLNGKALTLQVKVPGLDFRSRHLFHSVVAPPVAERFFAENWQTGGAKFNPGSHLSTQPFGGFRGFLRNSRKYGQDSLERPPNGGHFNQRPRSLVKQSTLKPTTTTLSCKK